MDLKKSNNLLTSRRCTNKDIKDDQILDLLWATEKLSDESNNASEKYNISNREYTK